MRRLISKLEKNLDGKIFNEFIALILISCLDKLDVLECYEAENRALRIGEMLNKQAEIYETLGIELPTSSC